MQVFTNKAVNKYIKEHLSVSISLIVFWYLISSDRLPYWLQLAASLAMVVGVVYNHWLCRKLGEDLIVRKPD